MEVGQNSNSDSVPASSSQASATDKRRLKIHINVDENGLPWGELSEKLATRVGALVRVHCPISYSDWRQVPVNFKRDIWNALVSEYEFNVPSQVARPFIEKSYSQKFRTGKRTLRTDILEDLTKDQALDSCPAGMNPAIWKGFVDNEYTEEMIKKRKTNAENRNKSTIRHRLGRRSYVNNNYILAKKGGIPPEDRAGSWMKGHEMKGGGVDPTAIEKYEQVKAAKEKRKTMGEEGSSSNVGFDSDVLAEVFGLDNGKGYVRGHSSYTSKKHAQHGALASSLIERALNKSNAPWEAKFEHIEDCMKTIMQQLQNKAATQATVGDPTFSSKTGSNSEHPTSRRNLNPVMEGELLGDTDSGSRVSEKVFVNLLNRDGDVVGTGYIETGKNGEFCHNRKILPNEKKVRVEVVNDINAPVPDPPQGEGHFTLGGFSEGGWLIWLESRLQPRR